MRVTRDLDPSEIRPGVEGGDFRPPPPIRKKSRWLLRGLVLLVLIAGAAFGYRHFRGEIQAVLGQKTGEAPVIKADAAPIKVKPTDPGGAEIPDRDKLVYERLAGKPEGPPKVEHLLPPPEQPLPPPVTEPLPKVPTEKQVAAAAAPAPAKIVSPPGAPPEAPPAAPEAKAVAAAPEPKTVPPESKPAEKVQPMSEVMARTEPPQTGQEKPEPEKAAPKSEAKPAAAGPYQVQIAAVRQEDVAKKEFTRLQRLYPDLLGDLSPYVVRADLGPGKGVFFRLRAGPLATEDAARKRCQGLTKAKVGCLVVRVKE